VALDGRRVHAEGPDIVVSVGLDLIAHGGELAVSAGSVVPRIEHEEDPGFAEQPAELIGLPVRSGRREIGGKATCLE
jgi:hypothetical protein